MDDNKVYVRHKEMETKTSLMGLMEYGSPERGRMTPRKFRFESLVDEVLRTDGVSLMSGGKVG